MLLVHGSHFVIEYGQDDDDNNNDHDIYDDNNDNDNNVSSGCSWKYQLTGHTWWI